MLRLHNNPEFSAPCQCLPVLWFSRYLGLVDSEYFWDDCNGLPRRVVMQQKGTFGHTVFALKEGKKSCEALVLDLDEDVYFSTLSTLPPPRASTLGSARHLLIKRRSADVAKFLHPCCCFRPCFCPRPNSPASRRRPQHSGRRAARKL